MYIEATPQLGSLVLYNANMEKVSLNNNRIQVLKVEKAEQKLPDTTKRMMEAQENVKHSSNRRSAKLVNSLKINP